MSGHGGEAVWGIKKRRSKSNELHFKRGLIRMPALVRKYRESKSNGGKLGLKADRATNVKGLRGTREASRVWDRSKIPGVLLASRV